MLLITLSCTKDQNLPLIFFQYTPSHTFWQGMAWCSCFVTLALALHPFIFWSHSLIPSSFIFVSKPQLWSLCCFNWRHLHFSACLERSTHQGQAQCLKPTSCIWSHLLLTTNLYVNLPWCTPPMISVLMLPTSFLMLYPFSKHKWLCQLHPPLLHEWSTLMVSVMTIV